MATIADYECPQCHHNGTVDYYCPRRGQMVRGASSVPADALALMADDETARVRRHLWRQMGAHRA
jgi:hypothetical protein